MEIPSQIYQQKVNERFAALNNDIVMLQATISVLEAECATLREALRESDNSNDIEIEGESEPEADTSPE